MPRKPDPLDPAELLLQFEQGLQRTAIAPGIDAYKPHDSQKIFHESSAKGKLYIGGNRSGKTVGGGAETVMRLTGKHKRTDLPKPPVRGRMVTVDIEEGIYKIAVPEIQKWLPVEFLKNGSWDDSFDKKNRTLTLTNGSFLEFMSYEQLVEKFAGTSRHFVWFDEEPPADIFNECMMRLVDTDGDWWITMTPLIEMSWTKDQLYDPYKEGKINPEELLVLEVNTDENPHINISAMERLSIGQTDSEKSARRSGTYISHTGRIYGPAVFSDTYYNQGGNLLPDVLTLMNGSIWRDLLQKEHFIMMDHGLNNPSAFLFCAYDTRGRMYVYDELYIKDRNSIVRDNARLLLSRISELGITPSYIVGDPSIQNRNAVTGTSVQIEYAEHGVNIALGNNDVRAGIGRTQGRFAKRLLFISERCTETLRELGNYRWDRFASSKIANRRNAKDMPLKKNDHAMDALRYGVCSRPAMDEEVDIPFTNVLGLPVALNRECDWAACMRDDSASQAYDEELGASF